MISITRKQSLGYIILVGKKVFTFAGVNVFGYGCGVSKYLQFYDREVDEYQVLPRPYLGSLEGENG